MHDEPEVFETTSAAQTTSWADEWHGGRNQEPSNADIDPMTLYDRTSYEYEGSSQDTIGSGIFSMEEGATWRARDGMFAHQYALPAYIGDEDELGVQQSEMWDSTADNWRVTQPSSGGVPLSRRVAQMKPAYSPFANGGQAPVQMRPEVTGPRSHIEAFGRQAAHCIVAEAKAHRPENRGRFLKNALDSLGPNSAAKAKVAADSLIRKGYRRDVAMEDVVAHLVMHAATRDLTDGRRRQRPSLLPRLDAMSKRVSPRKGADLRKAAAAHILPLSQNTSELRKDLGALYQSPAARGIGEVVNGDTVAASQSSFITPKNMLIAGGVGLGAYLLFANRKKIAKNIKKVMK